ncbi:MAG TPA: hypothetical protein PLJ48_02240, partial [Dermatophilaceae bacterium]|nr:hypothetical protein [Dermatophilaceae bacterium]
AKRGMAVNNHLCEHFPYSRQELYHLIRVGEIRSFEDLLARHVEDVGVHYLCRHDRDSSVCRARSLPAVGPEPLSGVS